MAIIEDFIYNQGKNWIAILLFSPFVVILFISEYLKVNRKEKGEINLSKKEIAMILSGYVIYGIVITLSSIVFNQKILLIAVPFSLSLCLYEAVAFMRIKFPFSEYNEDIEKEDQEITNELVENFKNISKKPDANK
jgi:uncharacterized membrane protein YjfL (UPF0719 family)